MAKGVWQLPEKLEGWPDQFTHAQRNAEKAKELGYGHMNSDMARGKQRWPNEGGKVWVFM